MNDPRAWPNLREQVDMTKPNDAATHRLAQRIANRIFDDMYGRSGFDHWWDQIHHGIQRDIRAKWVSLVEEELAASDGR